jgi:hypothetical protein
MIFRPGVLDDCVSAAACSEQLLSTSLPSLYRAYNNGRASISNLNAEEHILQVK